MLTLIVIILILALVFGGWSFPRYGYPGFSPLAIVLIILLVLWLAGLL